MEQVKRSILVVEDDPAILRGLLDVLVFNGYNAEGVDDGDTGLEKCLQGSHDLVILDVMLPGVDGFTICRRLRREKPDQAIIILTAKGSENDIITGFAAGADDYLSKPFSIKELLVRVEALLRRCGKPAAPEKTTINSISFDPANLVALGSDRRIEMTRREMDIVLYLHRNRERIVSKQELLKNVWNYMVTDIETRTVDIHILKLRKKIQQLIGGRPFIVTIRGEGYRLEVES
ncbi:MAG: response regulator transcription factor [Deltaproteobacteria bacterium]|jgi:DNA-binding response OmpR family regulator|nr:response regulator transcription factor [Deltaproteobacteria bacterium]